MTAPAFARSPEAAAVSPCIGICVLEAAPDGGELCRGCARTAGEIGAWPGLAHTERLAIMARLPARKTTARADFDRYSDV